MKKLKTKLRSLLLIVPLLFSLFVPTGYADFLPVQVQASDAVAGFPALFKTSIIEPNQEVRFVVEKPDGSVVQIPAQADLEGIAKADLFGHQTKQAGVYKVAVVYPGSANASPQASFKVFPDQISSSQSTVRSTLQLVESTKDVTFVVVTLLDQYRNPIPDHRVKLLSSRSEDVIEVLQEGVSDQNGRANFKVSSKFPGVSIYTAMDITANHVLQDREEIVFFAASAPVQDNSILNLFKADIGGEGEVLPGPVDRFEIEGLPQSAKVGDQLSLSVIAKDKDGNVAKNYTGTILISVPDDENAVLPNNGEYTFKAADQGKFTFDLSLQFSKLGNQVVQVFDKGNFRIAGEQAIEINSGQSGVPAASSKTLVIKSPVDGSELGSQFVILTGKGNENINLKVFDNDIKIGDTETDGDGFFSFEARGLSSGPHQFYVMSEKGEVSESISIKIDTVSPVLNGFETDINGVANPGEKVEIKIQSEPSLEVARIRLQGIDHELAELSDQPGNYVVTVSAPAKDGDFPLDVILIDALGNKSELLNKGSIKVAKPEPKNPPQVQELLGEAIENTIQLKWQMVEESENPIDHYKIYYGEKFDELNKNVKTDNSTNSWALADLDSGKQYFIAIKAVDTKGLESLDSSTVIAVTTKEKDLCANLQCGDNGTCNEGVCSCENGWTGLTCNIQEEQSVQIQGVSQLQAIPYAGSVALSWPTNPNVQAFYYKVFIGFSPGQYSDYLVTKNNQPQVLVNDLIDGVTYYFAVAALDINQAQISPISVPVQATPSLAAFKPAAPDPNTSNNSYQYVRPPQTSEVGPETLWIILGSIVFAHFWYNRKKKVIQICQNKK